MTSVVDRLTSHLSTINPGQPFRLGAAHSPGDGVWQGDLGIEIVAGTTPPDGYELIERPTDADRQLAIEAGAGSHHRLRSFDGVTLYRPKDWGRSEADTRGPFIVFATPNAIVHEPGHDKPHGTVFIDNPCSILIRYQRNLDAQTRQEIRAGD